MLPEDINVIDEAQLRGLVEGGATESKTLEFKRELPGQSDAERVRLVRVITSFSNTVGGDLVLGVETQEGRASAVVGIAGVNEDQFRLRVENLCRDGVDPRLPGVALKFVTLANGGTVIVIRVAQSWNGPHRVTAGGHAHFYARNSAGSYQMDVGELRAAFTAPDRISAEIRRYRAERIAAVQSYATPVPIQTLGALVLHVLPFSAFSPIGRPRISLTVPERHEFAPFDFRGGNQHVNLEGYVLFTHGREPSAAYTQISRTGAIESVATFDLWEGEEIYKLPATWIERRCVEMVRHVVQQLSRKFDPFPFAIGMALVNIRNYRLATPRQWGGALPRTDRGIIEFPTIVVEHEPLDAARELHTTFDMMWNAFGLEGSASYDDRGNFNPRE